MIFIKDAKARYLFANRTLVQRCGVKQLDFLLGKTSAEVFPEQLGAAYTEQDERVLRLGIALEEQLELHLFGSREPGWCITAPDFQSQRTDHRIGRHFQRPAIAATRTRPTSGWRRWIAISGRISAGP